MGKSVLKYINYTKEAFFWPVHLIGLASLGIATAALSVFLPHFWDIYALGLPFSLAGLELLYLGLIPRNRGFVKMVNRKYYEELKVYNHLREVARFYNDLSGNYQRKYERVRAQLAKTKQNYSSIHPNFPDLVKQYVEKIDGLQVAYIKLLHSHYKAAGYLATDQPDKLLRQIQGIQDAMVNDSAQIQSIKRKRIELLEERIKNQGEVSKKFEVMGAQIKTMEEMINYFVEHSVTGRETGYESELIDNLIAETSELHDTLADLEEIMNTTPAEAVSPRPGRNSDSAVQILID